jgi:hypothetical protein
VEAVSKVDSVGQALGGKAVDARDRKTELELSDALEEIATAHNLFLKEPGDARSGAQALYSSAQLPA